MLRDVESNRKTAAFHPLLSSGHGGSMQRPGSRSATICRRRVGVGCCQDGTTTRALNLTSAWFAKCCQSTTYVEPFDILYNC